MPLAFLNTKIISRLLKRDGWLLPSVSVVIPAYNEERHIKRCIESLLAQNFNDIEIIVVDNGSRDRTAQLVEKFVGEYPGRVRLIRLDRNWGPGGGRNVGALHANGEILVFVDADMTFPPDYIGKMVEPIMRGEALMTTHLTEYVANIENPWVKVQGQTVKGGSGGFSTIVRAIRRDFFLKYGGFDPSLHYHDDRTFYYKTGIAPLAVKDAYCYHLGVIHIRARGNPARLRNIALRTALDLGIRFFAFIESDILVDKDFLRRALRTVKEHNGPKPVFSVSMVWDVGYENLDWLEKLRVRWLKSRSKSVKGEVFEGEACNTSACLIDLERVREVGFFDEDIWFIEDLDWGRRATRKGYSCLFDSRIVLTHLRRYSLREFRKYFMRGALSEAKLFLKNGIALRALRSALYWDAVLAAALLAWFTPIPLIITVAVGYAAYFRRCVGLGRLLLYPITAPFSIARSVALTAAMLYWVLKGGYRSEKVTVLGEPDWEVVDRWMLGSR